jgi:hypothetical protein
VRSPRRSPPCSSSPGPTTPRPSGGTRPPSSRSTAELEVDQGEIGPDSEVEVDVPAQGAVVFVVVGIGGPVTMRAEGNGFDSTLTVVDADGDQLAYNDDTDGLDPQVQFDLEVDEELTVEVRSFGGVPGEVVVVREDDPG